MLASVIEYFVLGSCDVIVNCSFTKEPCLNCKKYPVLLEANPFVSFL